ncbi:MAG: FHA domain-containing protein [Proteobacteria bacterium]|nr:FHA domain-containing protein [Pseudomonadota bacterium]
MKLLFPNGEHDAVEIGRGEVLVGAGADCTVMLAAPGIAPRHCRIFEREGHSYAEPLDGGVTVLNGRQISGQAAIKPGDLLLFARVGVRVVATEKVTAVPLPRRPEPTSGEDGRTRVRMALPKFIMRGVSGPTFGKTFGVTGTLTLGRSAECDISIPSDEISRHHAKLQLVADGVLVEDMGSANGTFVNNQRVHASALMKHGDELRLDTVRFMLMSPAAEAASSAPRPPEPVAASAPARSGKGAWIVVILIAVLLVAAVVALRHFGRI